MINVKKRLKILISTITCTLGLVTFSHVDAANAATWQSSQKFGYWTDNEYSMNNDIWGSGSGFQSIWADSYDNWGVWSAQPNTSNVKSYPHVGKKINKKLSDINTLTSSFDVTIPKSDLDMEAAYDIWLGNNSHEIMLWMNVSGNVKPLSYKYDSSGNPAPVYKNITIGGYAWDVYLGNNGQNMTYSFLKVGGNIDSGTVDVKAIVNWIKTTPKWFGDIVLDDVQFGYEITSSYNNGKGYNFKTNNFSITSN